MITRLLPSIEAQDLLGPVEEVAKNEQRPRAAGDEQAERLPRDVLGKLDLRAISKTIMAELSLLMLDEVMGDLVILGAARIDVPLVEHQVGVTFDVDHHVIALDIGPLILDFRARKTSASVKPHEVNCEPCRSGLPSRVS
jgi:hypothetical protein